MNRTRLAGLVAAFIVLAITTTGARAADPPDTKGPYPGLAAATVADTTSAARSTKDTTSTCVQVYGATATAVVDVQISMDQTAWQTVATSTNPSSGGKTYCGPSSAFVREKLVSRDAGSVTTFRFTKTLVGDPLAASWKEVTSAGATTGNAETATALAANPADCAANQFATTIAASGALTCAQPAVANLSDGSSGAGLVQMATPTVEAVTATKTPSAAESGEVYTNTGDADGAALTLLNDPTVGTFYRFALTVAQLFTITPGAGETLYLGADQCVASITATGVGANGSVYAATGGASGIWVATGTSLTCND